MYVQSVFVAQSDKWQLLPPTAKHISDFYFSQKKTHITRIVRDLKKNRGKNKCQQSFYFGHSECHRFRHILVVEICNYAVAMVGGLNLICF